MSRGKVPRGFGQSTEKQRQTDPECQRCDPIRKALCAESSEAFDPAAGPRWRGPKLDPDRYGTPLAHQALRIRLGASMVPVVSAYGVACTFSYDDTGLLLKGRMTLARFALQLDVEDDTARVYVNKLCCLDLMAKYRQRDVLPADEEPEHANAIALYVNNVMPPWVDENFELLKRQRKADGRQARQRIAEELHAHQENVIANMLREMDLGIKTQPKRAGNLR